MFCKNCGKHIDDDSRFCPYCGTELSGSAKGGISERKTVYDGEIHKCPNCGENLKSFELKCPTCGYELRGAGGQGLQIKELLRKMREAKSEGEKAELIANFYVPNTREDIIEFFALAVSQTHDDGAYSKAWSAKLEQTLIKAKILFGENSEQYKGLVKTYRSLTKKKFIRLERKSIVPILWVALSVVALVVSIIMITVGFAKMEDIGLGLAPGGLFLMIASAFSFGAFAEWYKKRKSKQMGGDKRNHY